MIIMRAMFRKLFRKKELTVMKPGEAIDTVIRAHIAPLLKVEGYRKIGRTWEKSHGDFSSLINVQASRWNGPETGVSFVVNYGVYVPGLYEIIYDVTPGKEPSP